MKFGVSAKGNNRDWRRTEIKCCWELLETRCIKWQGDWENYVMWCFIISDLSYNTAHPEEGTQTALPPPLWWHLYRCLWEGTYRLLYVPNDNLCLAFLTFIKLWCKFFKNNRKDRLIPNIGSLAQTTGSFCQVFNGERIKEINTLL